MVVTAAEKVNAQTFSVVLDDRDMKPLEPLRRDYEYDGKDETRIAFFEATLPAPISVPANEWWTVRLNWLHLANTVCNLREDDIVSVLKMDPATGVLGEVRAFRLASFAKHVDSVKALHEVISDQFEEAADVKDFVSLSYGTKTHVFTLRVAKDYVVRINPQIAAALGLSGHVLLDPAGGDFYAFEGTDTPRSIYKGEFGPRPSLTLLSPRLIYVRLNIVNPIPIGRRLEPVIACINMDQIPKEKSATLTFTSLNTSSYTSGLLNLSVNELNTFTLELLNEDWEHISFAQLYPNEPCLHIKLEFQKGGNQLRTPF